MSAFSGIGGQISGFSRKLFTFHWLFTSTMPNDFDSSFGTGAPAQAHLKKKFLVTTGVSLLVWLLVYSLITSEIINFRELSKQMILEDNR